MFYHADPKSFLHYRISNLQSCTRYNITANIKQINTLDQSTYTHSDIIETSFETPQTVIDSIIPFDDSFFMLWNSSNKRCIESYTISVYEVQIQKNVLIFKSAGIIAYEQNVTSIQPCTLYEVELLTLFKNELSSYETASVTTEQVHPGFVRDLSVTKDGITANSVAITWEKPDYGATCVEYYNIKRVEVKYVDGVIEEGKLEY